MIKIYHAHKKIENFDTISEVSQSTLQNDYDYVADVKTDDLDLAFFLTHSFGLKQWTDNPDVICKTMYPRSTMPGDIMECDGEYYLFKNSTFKKIVLQRD